MKKSYLSIGVIAGIVVIGGGGYGVYALSNHQTPAQKVASKDVSAGKQAVKKQVSSSVHATSDVVKKTETVKKQVPLAQLTDTQKMALVLASGQADHYLPSMTDIENHHVTQTGMGVGSTPTESTLNSMQLTPRTTDNGQSYYGVQPALTTSSVTVIQFDETHAYITATQDMGGLSIKDEATAGRGVSIDLNAVYNDQFNSAAYKAALDILFVDAGDIDNVEDMQSDLISWLNDYTKDNNLAVTKLSLYGAISSGNYFVQADKFNDIYIDQRSSDPSTLKSSAGTPLKSVFTNAVFNIYQSKTNQTGYNDPDSQALAMMGSDIAENTGTAYVFANDGFVYEAKTDWMGTFSDEAVTSNGDDITKDLPVYSRTTNKAVQQEYTNLLAKYKANN